MSETRIYAGEIVYEEIDPERLRKHLSLREVARRVWAIDEQGERRALPMRNDLSNHSPDGPHWGYGGSGPAQLALAILADWSGNDEWATHWHQDFKWDVIAKLPQDQEFQIASSTVQRWASDPDRQEKALATPTLNVFEEFAETVRTVARDCRAAAVEFTENDDIGRLIAQLGENLEAAVQQYQDELADPRTPAERVEDETFASPDLPAGVTAYVGDPETGEWKGPVSGEEVARAIRMSKKP